MSAHILAAPIGLAAAHDAARVSAASREDDREAILASQRGDREAFDRLVERHQREIYRLCYRYVNNHEDASDLAQDAFVKAYRAIGRFRGDSAFSTWLYRIAVNVSLNRVGAKRLPTEPIGERQHVDRVSESPAERILRGERAALVRAAIARLPRKQRAALILRVYHEMSHQEIADVLGRSVGAVKANVFHALQNVKKMLAEGGL